MTNIKTTIAGFALALISTAASAVPIIGAIEMSGSFYALDASGAQTSDASSAIGIDFFYFNKTVGDDFFKVSAATGDFDLAGSGAQAGSFGTISDFTFAPFSGPIDPFWSAGIFAFELQDVNVIPSSDPVNFLSLQGTGLITRNGGQDVTAGSWSFTGDTTGGGVFSWSSTTSAVPEPGILALLSVGLIAFAVRKQQA